MGAEKNVFHLWGATEEVEVMQDHSGTRKQGAERVRLVISHHSSMEASHWVRKAQRETFFAG